jgi:DNA polymerase I-like protein with 3'-5' exonuclease and polymerase domains
MGKAYLDSKSRLKAWKRRVWNQVMETQEVRTPLGRRKRLFVSAEEYASHRKTGRATAACKEGLNHLAQGMVADIMNLTIIAIKRRWPCSRLAFQAHDGHLSVWPESVNPWLEIREVVERVWDVGDGRQVKSTADWERINSDGTHEELK